MNRDGGAERLIWRQIRHLISCTMTCVGGTSVKRPRPRCADEERKSEEPAWIKVKNPKSPAATRAIEGTF
jgi:hypothetical protein